MNKDNHYFLNKYKTIFDAILANDLKGVNSFLKFKDFKKDNFALRLAVKLSKLDIVELLLNNGYDVHTMNQYPIITAEENRDYDMMGLLFKYGAKMNCIDIIAYDHIVMERNK